MKIAIICDTHFGGTSEPFAFLDHQKEFYDTVFFPTLKKHKIKHVLHLGDLVDKRRVIDYQVSERMRKDFLDPLQEYDVHIIAGNHDVYYKNTNRVNAFNELLSHYNFMTYTDFEELDFDGKKILLVPWINEENEAEIVQKLRQTKNKLVFGHFEIQGFEMTKGQVCEHGIEPSFFEKFSKVFSGHFHRKSVRDNIYYLGSPFQMTWDDYGDERGFHLFDLETEELEFIPNPKSLYVKVFYDDVKRSEDDMLKDLKKLNMNNTYVKIIVENKHNPNLLEKICSKLEEITPLKMDIVQAQQLFSSTAIENKEHIKDTIGLIKNVIKNSEFSEKDELEKLMIELYNEAQNGQIGS